MDTASSILETIEMISEDRLDIRTVTIGISLLDCADSDGRRARRHCCERVAKRVADLVSVYETIETELGILVINKRVSVTPIVLVAAASRESDLTLWVQMLDEAAAAIGVDFIGGFSALVEKGATASDLALIDSVSETLSSTKVVCSSVNVGSSRAGVNIDAVWAMGEAITASAQATENGLRTAKLVVFANSVGDNPFMAGTLHGVETPDYVVFVRISGPSVVTRAIASTASEPFDALIETVKKSAFGVTHMRELVGRMAAERLGVDFEIVDLSLASTSEIGDSVVRTFEAMGLEHVGTYGTTAALILLSDAVKKGGLMACSRVDGLSGSFILVSEDESMTEAAEIGTVLLAKLEATTAICSVGLDMVAVPDDIPSSTIAGMIADETAIGVTNHKTTAVRIIPVPGTAPGNVVESGGLLDRAPVMPVGPYSNEALIGQEGLTPVPVHGSKD